MQPGRQSLVIFVLFIAAGLYFIFKDPQVDRAAQTAVAPRVAQPTVTLDAYGLPENRFERAESVVKRGQTLSDILGSHGLSAMQVNEIVHEAGDALDVRRIRPGDRFIVYSADTSVAHLVYQPNLVDYVVIDVADQIDVRTGARPVEVRRKTVSGVIEGSLYGAVLGQGGDPALVDRIANDIYAWTVDFRQLQRGDAFSVVYEEQYVDGDFFGIGEIIASRLDHSDRPHLAYRFEQDGDVGYFDEEGNSLRKALLKSPLRYSRVTSGYTQRRFHPVQKRYKAHLGTDYAAPTGTPIMSVGDGVVVEAQFKRANGNYVKIRHNGTYTTGYLHMSRIAKGIRPGTRVKQGEVIGYVGSTGLATGPHVCFRFWKNGVQVDSRREEMPPSEPVKPEHRMAFVTLVSQVQGDIDPVLYTPQLASVSARLGTM